MNLVAIKANLITTMLEITDIGFVDSCDGRVQNLPWEGNDILPLWVVTVDNGQDLDTDDYPSTVSTSWYEHSFQIKGYLPFSFEASNGDVWDAYLQAVVNKLSPKPALDVCAETQAPSIDTNDYVMYGAGDGAVLCHYAELTFKAIEHYTPA